MSPASSARLVNQASRPNSDSRLFALPAGPGVKQGSPSFTDDILTNRYTRHIALVLFMPAVSPRLCLKYQVGLPKPTLPPPHRPVRLTELTSIHKKQNLDLEMLERCGHSLQTRQNQNDHPLSLYHSLTQRRRAKIACAMHIQNALNNANIQACKVGLHDTSVEISNADNDNISNSMLKTIETSDIHFYHAINNDALLGKAEHCMGLTLDTDILIE
ncbi:hypothetical protein RRG08_041213 [Elysia crispata]|uniref:Uncharacterized protein n=1 Tax=Elysia crispata TaxID=231223 RepID=A0AAE1DZ84_9GAST|nr:hypothetical protein RRG08_041213 [Elysia crispata]